MPSITFIWELPVSDEDVRLSDWILFSLAENVADACGITRQEQDEFALQSQLKCEHAVSLGHFDAEIEPIVISTSKSMSEKSQDDEQQACFSAGDIQIRTDEYPRKGASIEGIAKLKTVFKEGKESP